MVEYDDANTADDRLRLLIERIERLEEEKKGIGDDIKDVYNEAKATGYDAKIMRQIVRLRKMKPDDRREMEAVLETYKNALLHPRELLGRCLGLVSGLPFGGREAVDHFACGGLVPRKAAFDDPVRQAIAAEARKAHQVDVLGIVAVLEVLYQAAEGGGRYGIGKRIDCIRIHGNLPWVLKWHGP